MPSAEPSCFNRRSSIVRRRFLILILLLLPLTACGRYKARQALRKTQYFAEILKRENLREIGADGFFRENLMENPDAEVRRWCAIALGRIGDSRALPLLYGALHAGDAEVRAAAVFAIGEIEDRKSVDARCSDPDPRAVAELFRLLDDSSVSIRWRALEALGKIGSRSDAADLVRRLERVPYNGSVHDKAYRETAITALARMGNPASAPHLGRLAETRDPEIRRLALEAHTRLLAGAENNQTGGTPQMRHAAAAALCGIGESTGLQPGNGPLGDALALALATYRKNSTIARMETTRGAIEIELFREDAPVTAERFVAMAKRGVYDDTAFAVAVPSRIVEGGNPTDWPGLDRTIRGEVNMRPFARGRVGMAVSGSGSDTGKFFITLSPQPYMDGTHTCFGYVISGMQVADRLTSGDRVLRITIRERIHFHDYQRY